MHVLLLPKMKTANEFLRDRLPFYSVEPTRSPIVGAFSMNWIVSQNGSIPICEKKSAPGIYDTGTLFSNKSIINRLAVVLGAGQRSL
jgi:hypothetical protein